MLFLSFSFLLILFHLLSQIPDPGIVQGRLSWRLILNSQLQVCDKPLAVMDARTFNKENEVQNKVDINFIAFMFHNLGGSIIFDTMQKWYYYSMQTTKEVLVFHQYSKVLLGRYLISLLTGQDRTFVNQKSFFQGKYFANPHTAFENRNCPKDTKSRISAESRVALFF